MDEILDIRADVVSQCPRLRFPYESHNRDIRRLLTSGKNVISINGHVYPRFHGDLYFNKFQTACLKGRATLFGTGLNPGFVVEKVAAVATGICLDIDHIQVWETFDLTPVPDHDYVFNIMGFGSYPAAFDLSEKGRISRLMGGMYKEVIALLMKRLGLPLDRVDTAHTVDAAQTPISARAGTIDPGRVAATHWCWQGICRGKKYITLNVSWVMGNRFAKQEGKAHWKIRIQGTPGIEICHESSGA